MLSAFGRGGSVEGQQLMPWLLRYVLPRADNGTHVVVNALRDIAEGEVRWCIGNCCPLTKCALCLPGMRCASLCGLG